MVVVVMMVVVMMMAVVMAMMMAMVMMAVVMAMPPPTPMVGNDSLFKLFDLEAPCRLNSLLHDETSVRNLRS